MRKIETVTREFGKAYDRADDATKKKAKLQEEFFTVATAQLTKKRLATRVVTMPKGTVSNKGDVERWIATYHPGWRFISWKGDSAYDMILEEDPALMKFSFPNPQDGKIYQRTVNQAAPSLDDEHLREKDPDLWERITVWPELHLVEQAMNFALTTARLQKFDQDPSASLIDLLYELNPGALAANFLRAQGAERVLKPTSDISTEDLAAIQDYLVPGPINTRLVKPRPAKEEEFE